MADSGQHMSYSCKCLNVQLQASLPPSSSPEEHAGDSFVTVFVGDEGINIAHTQLTLRNRGPPIQRRAETVTETIRAVSLTCLICQTLVYRVTQVISPDLDSGEGPVLPTDEWAESEVLKSSKGWVQVSKHCLSGKDVKDAETSPAYSKPLRVIVSPSDLSSSNSEHYYVTPPPSSPEVPSTPRTILPHIPALFPPPPFTPTHPVFTHLVALASVESERLRTDAENQLRKIVEEKVAEVNAAEARLKQDVECLWVTFKESVDKIDADINASSGRSRPNHRRSASRNSTDAGINGISVSVRVKDFVPAPAPPPRSVGVSSARAVSALSASLATSSLHDAMAAAEPDRSRGSHSPTHSLARSTTARADSPSTASSKTLGVAINGEAEIRDAYRRNMDENLDIATSYKYMLDIGAHVISRAPEVPEALPEEDDSRNEVPSPSTSLVPRGRSPRAGKSAIKKPKGEETENAKQSPQRSEEGQITQKENTTPKGKRKVTFDVKPEVAIIATDSSTLTGENSPRSEEAVFDMDNENTHDAIDGLASTSAPLSEPEGLVPEQAEAIRRTSRRGANLAGLSSSFSTLRPASLPMPSAIRAPAAAVPADERSRQQSVRDSLLSAPDENEMKRRDIEEPREFQEDEKVTDPREAEILRLVAASTPSHRSAWKKDTSAWRTFVARQKAQKHERSSSIPEEDESSATDGPAYYDESGDSSDERDFWNNDNSIAKSLPIPIGPLGTNKKAFGSYQTKALTGSTTKASAAALRRASYAERDRNRSADPGALDFTEEDEVDDDEDGSTQAETEGVAKSMQRAAKILQKGSETPGAGMWRSLA